jgi:two-component system sensor kinase FixL
MNWVTIIWSMSAAVSLTLGAIHFVVWLQDRKGWANLFFALAAVAVAGIAVGEFAIMTAQTPQQIGKAQQWAHVPIFVLVVALVGFVQLYFGTGRLWLGVAGCAARAMSLVINFALPPNLNFREVTGVRHVEFLGQTVSVPEGVASSWTRLGELSSLLVLAFVVDASVALWRQGKPEGRRRAVVVGVSITVFIIIAAGIAALINAQVIHWPYLISLPFLGIIVEMGFELSYDVLRAAQLARRLEASESSLRETEERFRIVADAAPVLIWMSSVDKLCTFFNKPWLEFTGRSLEQEMGNGWAEGVHPDDLQRCLKVYTEAFDARKGFVMQYRLRRNDGEYRWVSDQGVTRYDSQGKFAGYIGSCLDVTELINKEQALRESEERMSLAADAAHLGMWEWDLNTDEMWSTKMRRALFGLPTSGKITFKDLISLVHIDDRDRIQEALKHAIESREDYASEYRLVLPDGGVRWMEARGRCVTGEKGAGIRLIGVSIDVTPRKLAEAEALRHREELGHLSRVAVMGEMAASIAHELNQPLSGITSNASAGQRFIDRGDVDLGELRDLLTDIVADGRRAGDVLRGIQSMVKKSAPVRQQVNLNDLVMNVVRIVNPDAVLHSCELQTLLEANLPAIEADPIQLQQVLLNLVINAFDAMRDTPLDRRRVVIATERNGDGAICASVRDYGVGISEEARDRLFEHFFTTKAEGLGMGLGIVRSIVESHAGTVAAENVAGGGARFHFTLPASAAA